MVVKDDVMATVGNDVVTDSDCAMTTNGVMATKASDPQRRSRDRGRGSLVGSRAVSEDRGTQGDRGGSKKARVKLSAEDAGQGTGQGAGLGAGRGAGQGTGQGAGQPAPPPTSHPPLPASSSLDQPTDAGDTSEDDAGESSCPDHDHFEIVSVDRTFNLSVDELFEAIFSDSETYRTFTAARKIYDVRLEDWPTEPDEEGNKVREIKYILSLNYAIGPKSTPIRETQTIAKESCEGVRYFVDTDTINEGVPYGSSFTCINRFCMLRITDHRSSLFVSSELRYKKRVWGLIKSIIDKNAIPGILESYGLLGKVVNDVAQRQSRLSLASDRPTPSGKKKVLRHRRAVSASSSTRLLAAPPEVGTEVETPGRQEVETPGRQAGSSAAPARGSQSGSRRRAASDGPRGVEGGHHSRRPHTRGRCSRVYKGASTPPSGDWNITISATRLSRIMICVFLCLVVLNVALYWKLQYLEARKEFVQRNVKSKWSGQPGPSGPAAPLSKAKWSAALAEQQDLHRTEMDRWRDVLSSSGRLLDHMHTVMADLEAYVT